MIKSNDFPNILSRVKELEPIVNQYIIEDVVMASFCISVCVQNRSALESLLALNWAVANHSKTGRLHIETYEQFSDFFDKIAEIMKPDIYSDLVEEDFGEVSIDVYGNRYYVIIGTGHNMVYSCLQFFPYLASYLGKEKVLIEVLEYYSGIIKYLRNVNISDGKHDIRFVIPDKCLFSKVKTLLSDEAMIRKMESIAKHIDSDLIEKKHFFIKEGKCYPLANTSLLLDLYDSWYRKLKCEQKRQFINQALTGIALSLSKLERDNAITFLCPVARTEDKDVSVQLEHYPFVNISRKGIILPINSWEYDSKGIDTLYEKINTLAEKNSLFLAELVCRTEDKQLRGVTIERGTKIKFLVIDDWANPEENYLCLGNHEERYLHCNALDVVYYLLFMKDADELYDYLCFENEALSAKTIGFGGDSSRFLMWQESGHMFEKGAIQYGLIDIGHNTENECVVEHFRNKLKGFPIGRGDYILDNPFAWEIQEKESGFYQYVLKEHGGYGGLFCPFSNDSYFFFSINVEFFNGVQEYANYKDIVMLMEDLFQRMLRSLREVIERSEEIKESSIQVMLMPYAYAKKTGMAPTLEDTNRKYAYSDSYWTNGKLYIRYVPIIDGIYTSLSTAKDRSAEVDIFLEIIAPMKMYYPDLYSEINEESKKIRSEKKEISLTSFQIEYKWNREEEKNYVVHEEAYHRVRKHIAKVCFEEGVIPGEYYGRDATAVVRSIQRKLIDDFEKEVSKYDYLKLYEKTLAVYATLVHEIIIHRKRYENIGDIKSDVKKEALQEIIRQREEAKRNARVSSYLLETTLFLSCKGTEELSNEKMQDLIAYANWLVILSDDADMCHFTEKEVKVEVTSEYIIDVDENTGLRTSTLQGLAKRQYDDPGYIERDYDEDLKEFEIVKTKFQLDTKVSFESVLSLLYYLETGGAVDKELSYRNNVICFWKEDILNDYCTVAQISMPEAKRALKFVTIATEDLKTKNGKKDYYLPIGEKEKRDNRFEVKPVYEYDEMIIYAPSVVHSLREYWQNSLFEFCMPYEIGMSETKKALDDWKRVYEKKIVFDLETAFRNKGYLTWHNLELKKLCKGKHPDYLGDYDVLAVNIQASEIWIIECKVLEKVETFYEMYRQQNRFFNEDKYDDKFQRRIDYMKKNYAEVANDLGIPKAEYVIKPFMCVNKVFASRYKEIDFPIKSYKELIDLINE